jgi:ERCC4-related helicase
MSIKKNEKAIIFTDRKETQKMIQFVVSKQFDIYPSIINGDSPSSINKFNNSKLSRQQTIDYFQKKEGFNVIVMSPLAAGVGLNVVGANHVIHYSRHWNPAKEEQATDRAYRIGQTKDVYVYYPMAIFPETNDNSKNHKSFDLVLNNLLLKKKELAIGALYPSEQVEVKQNEIISELGF